MKKIRLAYPTQIRIYWIQDGLSSHWTAEIRSWAAENNMELVPTPTYASYLNRIESTFGAIDEFVCKNADYLDWLNHERVSGATLREGALEDSPPALDPNHEHDLAKTANGRLGVCTLIWNCFSESGQPPHHAHLHVIPRFDDEPFADRGGRSAIKVSENRRPDPSRRGNGRAQSFGRRGSA